MRDATPKSFVILDGMLERHLLHVVALTKAYSKELGRGTSTYVSLAICLVDALSITSFCRMEWRLLG
jgi:hypothetical protein